MLTLEDLPDCLFSDKRLLVGCLNARHRNLGSISGSQNINGFVWNDILDALDNVKVLGKGEATHVRGGRLDYAVLFNMNEFQADACNVYELLRDHFALKVVLFVDKLVCPTTKKRYKLKEGQHTQLITKVDEWYKEYKPC